MGLGVFGTRPPETEAATGQESLPEKGRKGMKVETDPMIKQYLCRAISTLPLKLQRLRVALSEWIGFQRFHDKVMPDPI